MDTKKWVIVLVLVVLTFLVACEQGLQKGGVQRGVLSLRSERSSQKALAGKAGETSKRWFRDG